METALRFLKSLEEERRNGVRTRNHRLAVLHSFYEFLALQQPELLREAERVAAIPTKRCHPAETFFLEREEVMAILEAAAIAYTSLRERDRALLLFMYNTGARVQEISDLEVQHLNLDCLTVRLHGKGDKWRVCPLWQETGTLLRDMLSRDSRQPGDRVFQSRNKTPLTRFGIYKIVRRHTASLCKKRTDGSTKFVSPHILRHTTAVHLLESGVEVNVIRAWLGHVSLETTNRYAEINMRTKAAALEACSPPVPSGTYHRSVRWRDDADLLKWLNSL